MSTSLPLQIRRAQRRSSRPAFRALAATAIVLTMVCVVAQVGNGQTQRPNIVLIVSDDLGYADIGVYGSREIPTPSIDRIAREGIRFTNAYVSGPYCSPTRAGLMTGRYPQRFGFEFNPDGSPDYGLPLTETTLADRLKAVGYRTALFGKWHLGSADRLHPMRRGFEEFYGFLGAEHSYVNVDHIDVGTNTPDPLLDGMKPASSVTYLTEAFGDRAVGYIKQHASEPFFLYLAFNAAHVPMEAPATYLARFPNIADPQRRTYAAMVSAMDDAIGRTLTALRDQNLEEKTLVIFLNDNGGPTMPTTTVNASSNAPLRGSKRQTWEGGIRVAFAMSWKGRLDAGRVDHRPIIQLDVLPTALAAADVSTIGLTLDGVNLLPFLTGTATGTPHDALYWRFGGMMAIRRGDWKLVKTRDGPFVDVDPSALRDLSEAGLYNLSEDIGESRNRAAERPDKVKELSDLWQQWNRQLSKPLWSVTVGKPAKSNAGRCLLQENSRRDCGTQADVDVAEIDQRRRRS
jgi:arylsulfatase A-like enzyme